jgi:hypothetical protein
MDAAIMVSGGKGKQILTIDFSKVAKIGTISRDPRGRVVLAGWEAMVVLTPRHKKRIKKAVALSFSRRRRIRLAKRGRQ